MSNPLPCLRRTEPSAALIPHSGQQTLAYVPAARSDIRNRIHAFNRLKIAAVMQPRLNADAALPGVALVPA